MSMFPFYLIYVTKFEKTPENPTPIPIAIVPFLQYLGSAISSLFVYERLMRSLESRPLVAAFSSLIIIVASVPYYFLTSDPFSRNFVYALAPI